jgi:hypothetical protein
VSANDTQASRFALRVSRCTYKSQPLGAEEGRHPTQKPKLQLLRDSQLSSHALQQGEVQCFERDVLVFLGVMNGIDTGLVNW